MSEADRSGKLLVPSVGIINMLSFKRMRFTIDVILVCIRWYVAYPLSYRHLEEMMEERVLSRYRSKGAIFPEWDGTPQTGRTRPASA